MRELHHDTGFTIVEMIVTVVLAGIFLTFFIQMYRTTNAQQQSLIRQSIANDIARSNLIKFPTASSVIGYTCDSTGTASTNSNNLAVRVAAPGTTVLSSNTAITGKLFPLASTPTENPIEPDPGTIGEVTQTVLAHSPQGCAADTPIKLTSRVEYGFFGQRNTVEYSTYVF